jgi:Protein of unknown function (DUF2752)
MEGDVGERGVLAEQPPRLESLPHRRPLEHWLVLLVAIAGPVVLVILGTFVQPDPRGFGTHEKLGLPSCKMMDWFGVPCPGCGVTTSVALAAHGRFLDSIRNQPFGMVVVVGLPLVALWAVAGHLKGRDLYRDLSAIRLRPWGLWLGSALAIAWIYKLALVFGAFGPRPG